MSDSHPLPLTKVSHRGCRGSGSKRRVQAFKDAKNSEAMACLDLYLSQSLFLDYQPDEALEQTTFYQSLIHKNPIAVFEPSVVEDPDDSDDDEFFVEDFEEPRKADPVSDLSSYEISFKNEEINIEIPYKDRAFYHANELASNKVDIAEEDVVEYFSTPLSVDPDNCVITDTTKIPGYQELNSHFLDQVEKPAQKGMLFVAHKKVDIIPDFYVRGDDPMNIHHSPVIIRRTKNNIDGGHNIYIATRMDNGIRPKLYSRPHDFNLRFDDPLNLRWAEHSVYVETHHCTALIHFDKCSYLAPCIIFYGYATDGKNKYDVFSHEDHIFNNGDLCLMMHYYIPPDVWGRNN